MDGTIPLEVAYVFFCNCSPLRGDQFGEHRGLGISVTKFKVRSPHEHGILILENTFHDKGGLATHLH